MAAEALAGLVFIAFFMIFSVALIALFILWILMIIDCAQRDFRKDNEKVVWILVLVFLGILGAIIYYFAVKRKSRK